MRRRCGWAIWCSRPARSPPISRPASRRRRVSTRRFPYYGSAIKRETRYILENLAKTFKAAGTSLDRVVKAQVFLTELADFNGFDEVWREFFPVSPPITTARTTGLLIKDNLIEIDLIAAMPETARRASVLGPLPIGRAPFLSMRGRGRPPSLSATTTTISAGRGASGHRDRDGVDMVEHPDVVAIAERHVDRGAGGRDLDVGRDDRLAAADRLAHRPAHARMNDRCAVLDIAVDPDDRRLAVGDRADSASAASASRTSNAPSSSPSGTISHRSSCAPPASGLRITAQAATRVTGVMRRQAAFAGGRCRGQRADGGCPWPMSRSAGESSRARRVRPAPAASARRTKLTGSGSPSGNGASLPSSRFSGGTIAVGEAQILRLEADGIEIEPAQVVTDLARQRARRAPRWCRPRAACGCAASG